MSTFELMDELEAGELSIAFEGEGKAEISFIPIRPGTFVLRIPGTTGETGR